MKKLFKKISTWSTRKKTMWFAIFGMVLYASISVIYTLVSGGYLDSVLTQEWFEAMKWVVATGGGLSAITLIKGEPTNELDEESKG